MKRYCPWDLVGEVKSKAARSNVSTSTDGRGLGGGLLTIVFEENS
jgi:hypothetical protein